MSNRKQLLKAFNSLSQELKDEYIETLYKYYYEQSARKEEFHPREEWDYYFDIACVWYLSKHEDLLNKLCSKVVEENTLGYCNECEAELADGYWWSRPERNLKFCADCGEYVLKEEEEEEEEEEAKGEDWWNNGTHPCCCCGEFDETNRFFKKSYQIWCEVCADQVACKECGCWYFMEDTFSVYCLECIRV